MTPYFSTPDRCQSLIAESRRWIGTPFMAKIRAPGIGVDCVQLAYALYRASGFIGETVLPPYHVGAGRHLALSQVVSYIVASGRFDLVADVTAVQTGDLLGIRLTGVVHHVAVATLPGFCIHSTVGAGVFQQQLETIKITHVWRPCV